MPIYEYRCSECGCEKEYLQKVSDPLKTECPACGKPALQKKLTAAGFQLKGSGWYVTDFRDGGKKTEAKKTDAAKSDSSASKSDSAPSGTSDSNSSSTGSASSSSGGGDSGGKASSSASTGASGSGSSSSS